MKDIILSYASKDRERATIIVEALEKEGWTIWWDQTLLGGQDYELKITEEIKESRGVVVLLSHASLNSRWVKAECNYAMDLYEKPLMPVLLENVKLPIRFYSLNAVDLTNWNGRTDYPEYVRLLESLDALVKSLPSEPSVEDRQISNSEDNQTSANDMEVIYPGVDPSLTSTGLSRFIFLPFGIPFLILLLSHLFIKNFG